MVRAVKALNRAHVVFLMDRASAKTKLNALRRNILQRYLPGNAYPIVEAPSPGRPPYNGDYLGAVGQVISDKREILERLGEGQCGAFPCRRTVRRTTTVRIVELMLRSQKAA